MALSRTNRGTKTQSYTSQSANTLTSDSFSPAGGALLVVLFTEVTDDASHSLTMSSTFTGQGSWTTYTAVVADGFGNYYIARIAWSVCGSSPGSGTVTCTRRAGTFNTAIEAEFIECNGQNTVADHVENTASDTDTLALNLSGAPASTSYLFTNCHDLQGSAATPPTSFTSLLQYNSDTGSGGGYTNDAEKLGSGSQNNSWTGLGNFRSAACMVVVSEASGQPAAKRMGGVPFATRTRGVW